jgi:cell division septation protein DedD
MARGRRSAGDRVLEGKHVIGLFLLMLVFSGVFFTLGYVMGRNQYDGQVRAATDGMKMPADTVVSPKKVPVAKNAEIATPESDVDPATTSNNSDWDFYKSNKPAKSEPRLDSPSTSANDASANKALNARTRVDSSAPVAPPNAPQRSDRTANVPLIPSSALVIQVAALKRQDDALAIASSLQRKHYLAYVQTPQKDKFYRVQVGPFKDQKLADAAKKGLESEGFKAFYIKH